MPIFEVQGADGGTYEVDAADIQAAVATAKKIGRPAETDPYRKQAAEEMSAERAKGMAPLYGPYRQALQGATMGLTDELYAGLSTPIEMARRGTWNPVEGYNYAKAREDLELEDARKRGGWGGFAAEVAGGIGSGVGLARAGLTAAGRIGTGLPARATEAAIDGALYGAATGAAEGSGTEGRLTGAATGAGVGAGLGAALPVAGSVARGVWDNVGGGIQARINPERFANRQTARIIQESGATPQQITEGMRAAAADNQGNVWTVADQLGNAGQRALSAIARTPGEARQGIIDTLEARQLAQAPRVSQNVDEAFGTTGTARQNQRALVEQAREASGPLYTEAMNRGVPTWSPRLQEFVEDPIVQQGLARGYRIERLNALAEGRRASPTDRAVVDFNEATEPVFGQVPNMRALQMAKIGLDDIIEGYRDPTSGRLNLDQEGRAIDAVRRAYRDELGRLNPAYAEANAVYRGPMEVSDAVERGGVAAKGGRAADNIEEFRALPNEGERQGFRQGYTNNLLQKLEGKVDNQDVTRNFRTGKIREEVPAFALPERADQFGRQLGRERTMFDTLVAANKGSMTANNLADQQALQKGVDLQTISNLLASPWQAAVSIAGRSANALGGYTAPVNRRLADILMSTPNSGDATANIGRRLAAVFDDEMARRARLSRALRGVQTSASQQSSEQATQRRN